MIIFIVKNSSYSVEYVKKMSMWNFLDLFETIKEVVKESKPKKR